MHEPPAHSESGGSPHTADAAPSVHSTLTEHHAGGTPGAPETSMCVCVCTCACVCVPQQAHRLGRTKKGHQEIKCGFTWVLFYLEGRRGLSQKKQKGGTAGGTAGTGAPTTTGAGASI